MKPTLLFLIPFLLSAFAHADVTLPKILGDNMVLQRERPLPVWGRAAAGETVTVEFSGQKKSATADPAGNWQVILDKLPASATPSNLVITGRNTLTLRNILVGEVWLCGGQSNMEYSMDRKHPNGLTAPRRGPDPMPADLAAARLPNIRLFRAERRDSLPDVTSDGWHECDPDVAGPFSAIGFYFGRELQTQLKVPIGLIQSAWAGTRIEPWTPAQAYAPFDLFKDQLLANPVTIDGVRPGQHYQSMIKPLAPFALRGFLWYQGESNLIDHNDDSLRYAAKMKALIDDWRNIWNPTPAAVALPDTPPAFYMVQVAPLAYSTRRDPQPHTTSSLPEIWEAQTRTLSLPNTALAATIDLVEDFSNIHPPNKWDVGHRLALIALAREYGQKNLEYSGPMFHSAQFKGATATLEFTHAAGLKSRDGKPLSDFTLAGADGIFHPAQAAISADSVVLTCDAVPAPSAARFAWHETAQPNLVNAAGLPAIPFRTDSPR